MKTQQVEVDVDTVYYKGERLQVFKNGKEAWNYKVFLDGKEIDRIVSLDISFMAGEMPKVNMEILEG